MRYRNELKLVAIHTKPAPGGAGWGGLTGPAATEAGHLFAMKIEG